MPELFGAFWQWGKTLPDTLRKSLEQSFAHSRSLGKAHWFDHAVVYADDSALASNDEAVIAFSGELRNQPELARLAGLSTDSPPAQILLALLGRQPFEDLLQTLNGPFVIAYYDLSRKQFHLLRDQLGQRFLFHSTISQYGCTVFSETLPQLTALDGVSRQLDNAALADYFSLGYIPAPRTAYEAIAKVAPGTDDCGDGTSRPTPHRYWQPQFLPQRQITWPEAQEQARELLVQATRRLLLAHPEADFMLSGGIDSGLVTGLVSQLVPDETRQAYSIAFSETAYDESDLAAGTAQRCGVPLAVHRLNPADLAVLPSVLAKAGEPYADSSLLPTAIATRDTARKALFTGDGGDEVFGGYRRYQAMLLRHRLPNWLQALLRAPCRVTAALLPNPRDNRSRLANLKRSLQSLALPQLAAYGSFQQIASQSLRERLLATPDSQNYLEDWENLTTNLPLAHPVQRYNALDLMVYLPDDGFRKANLACAGTGVTYLCPILDMDVVRFALSLPIEYRFNSKENKRLLRHIGKEFLDPRILSQPKRGFGTPVADWFRNELAPIAQKLADEVTEWDIHKLLNEKSVKHIVAEHLHGQVSHGPLLWTLYCLRLWEEEIGR
jgi:asparagine synthase (glutamine-hydrolysing)